MQVSVNIEETHCPMIISIPPEKQGVVAKLSQPYVGPTYVNVVAAVIRNWYYFQINMSVYLKSSTHCITINRQVIGEK